MKTIMLAGALCFAGNMMADIVTSASCSFGTATQNSASYCWLQPSASPGESHSTATSSASVVFPGASAGFLTSTVFTSTNAIASSTAGGMGSATADISLDLATTGPVENGFLELLVPSFRVDSAPNNGVAMNELTFSIGDYTGYCDADSCYGGVQNASSTGLQTVICDDAAHPCGTAIMVPFILGEQFQFNFQSSNIEPSDPNAISASVTSATLQFRFLDANENAVALAPEPSTLLGLPIATLLFLCGYRKRIGGAKGIGA